MKHGSRLRVSGTWTLIVCGFRPGPPTMPSPAGKGLRGAPEAPITAGWPPGHSPPITNPKRALLPHWDGGHAFAGTPVMKAINSALRPTEFYEICRGVPGRSALKTIARKRLRAAERELFRREELAWLDAERLEAARRRQELHQRARRDVRRLIGSLMITPCPPQEHVDLGATAGRLWIEQQVLLVTRGRRRASRTITARASCAI